MTRLLSFAIVGAAAIGFTLASPAVSHAQSFGVHLDVGRAHFDVGRGIYPLPTVYPTYPRYVYPAYSHHHHHHHHVLYPPPVVVVPEPVYVAPTFGVTGGVYVPSSAPVIVRP